MNPLQYLSTEAVRELIANGNEQPFATTNYPSRGQTAVQQLYQTDVGKLFLKRSSKQNHIDCRIDVADGSLAERERWAYRLAQQVGLHVPPLWLLDTFTTAQVWLDYPDGRQYKSYRGVMQFDGANIFDCALFDWLTGQIDRHDANYLYNYVDQEIILIDSAHSFLKDHGGLSDFVTLYEATHKDAFEQNYTTQVSQRICSLTAQIAHQLVPLRNTDERVALEHRLEQIKKVISLQQVLELYRGHS